MQVVQLSFYIDSWTWGDKPETPVQSFSLFIEVLTEYVVIEKNLDNFFGPFNVQPNILEDIHSADVKKFAQVFVYHDMISKSSKNSKMKRVATVSVPSSVKMWSRNDHQKRPKCKFDLNVCWWIKYRIEHQKRPGCKWDECVSFDFENFCYTSLQLLNFERQAKLLYTDAFQSAISIADNRNILIASENL